MNKSESIANLAKALSAAQGSIKAALKDSSNPFFGSKYADLTAVWESCRHALSANGLAVTQSTAFIGESLVLETTLMHLSGEWVASVYPIKPVKNDPQGVGSAITYARRYSLSALVGVVADEDDDGNAASKPSIAPPKKTDSKGNEVTKQPTWTEEQKTEAGQVRADILEEFGDAGDKAWLKLRGEHKYDPPADVLDLAYTLLNDLREQKANHQ